VTVDIVQAVVQQRRAQTRHGVQVVIGVLVYPHRVLGAVGEGRSRGDPQPQVSCLVVAAVHPDMLVHLQHILCGEVVVEVEHAGAHEACTQILVCRVQRGKRRLDGPQHNVFSVQEPEEEIKRLAVHIMNGDGRPRVCQWALQHGPEYGVGLGQDVTVSGEPPGLRLRAHQERDITASLRVKQRVQPPGRVRAA